MSDCEVEDFPSPEEEDTTNSRVERRKRWADVVIESEEGENTTPKAEDRINGASDKNSADDQWQLMLKKTERQPSNLKGGSTRFEMTHLSCM